MAEYRGISYLRKKLECKRKRVQLRYRYYEMKNLVKDFNIVTPAEFRAFNESLGWCGKAVDSLADRLVFRTFRVDNFDLNTIYQMNNPDILFPSAVLSSIIAACSFIYIIRGDDGYPRLQVIDGANATGVIDDTTGLLKEGYAVLQRDRYNRPQLEAYLLPGVLFRYLGINVNDVFFPEHGDTSNLQEQFHHLIDTCTQDELEMLLSINREILIHTRKKDSVGEVQTV